MIQESIPSVWAYMYSWFTPTLFFVLLNLVIGTIAITSGLGSSKRSNNDGAQSRQQLTRAPSVVERLKSLNLHRFTSQDLNPFSSIATAFLHHQPTELDDAQETQVPVNEQQQEEARRPEKMKSAVGARSDDGSGGFEELEEMFERCRPSTVEVRKSGDDQLGRFGGDEEVDAKADDFINRFKQQLRLDSIMR